MTILPISAQLKIPWWHYYCASKELQPATGFISLFGFVNCPVCGNHLDNVQFFKHILSHLSVNELALGSLMSFEFCTECLCAPFEMTVGFHNRIHRHVELLEPFALMDGCFVCPICENYFTCIVKFAAHLYERHVYMDSPYVCSICYGFRSSYYCELVAHFRDHHNWTNHIFCPYCLKHFELPVSDNVGSGLHTFDAQKFYMHVQQHWEKPTYRCESCRLDFTHQSDLRWHEYLHHSEHPLIKPNNETANTKLLTHIPNNQLSLSYSNQLLVNVPRVRLKCMECGEHIRQPLHKHFSLTLHCATCTYTTSCSVAVNWHWAKVHNAPPIHQAVDSYETKSWHTYIDNAIPNMKHATNVTNLSSYSSYGTSVIQVKRCKDKHPPPGLFCRGYLRCNCGFRTIVYDQMARHLATNEEHYFATIIYGPRPSTFSVRSRPGKALRTSLWWRRKSAQTPYILQSVGLCQ